MNTDNKEFIPPVVLTFSSHDATGGSGISADIEAISSQGCHASTVTTCLTIQDSMGISSIIPIDDDIIIQSARAVLEDMPVAAIKLGLMGSVEVVEAVHSILYDYKDIPVIFAPLQVATIEDGEVLTAMRSLLLPLTDVLTANLGQAAALMPEADSPSAMANGLLEYGCHHVLLTAAHNDSQKIINRLYHNHREIDHYEWQRLPHNYHGSADTLAATLSALMALGLDVLSAAREAQHFTWESIHHARRLGMGQFFPNRLFWVEQE